MKQLGRWFVAVSVVNAVALGFAACGQPFEGASGVGDAGGTSPIRDGSAGDAAADAKPSAGDGAVADGAAGDARGAPCQGSFAALTLVLAHTSLYLVDSFTLTGDELVAFAALTPPGSVSEQRRVYEMHRAHAGDVFVLDTSQPVDLTETGPTPGAFDVGLSADGLTLYFSHRQDSDAGLLGVNIYDAQRGDAGAPFSTGSELGAGINDPTTNQFHAHPGGASLYFTVAPLVSGAQGQRDLYVSPLANGARAPIAELNGPTTQEATPVPSGDELELFFSSDRANPGGENLVYHAKRAGPALTFGAPALVPFSLPGTSANVAPQYLTADRCRLYVLVNQADVYVSQRAP